MNKLRVEKKSLYEIEVNDNGDTISFNIEDPSLPLRAEKAFDSINKIVDKCKRKILLIEKRQDKKAGKAILSENDRDTLKAYEEMYQDMRIAMDQFLGDGACEKIFGSANYLTMYDELFEALQPHMEKIGINAQNFIKSVEEKYGASDDSVIDIE